MTISEKIVDPAYKDELRTEMQNILTTSIGKRARFQMYKAYNEIAYKMIKDRTPGLEEPLFVTVLQQIYIETILEPDNTQHLLELLTKVDNIELYMNMCYHGNDISKMGINYSLKAVRVKILAMFNTEEATSLAIQEANQCTEISNHMLFSYSACFPSMFVPIVIAMHLKVEDQKRAYLDYQALKQMARRYGFALRCSETLDLVVNKVCPNFKIPKIECVVEKIFLSKLKT